MKRLIFLLLFASCLLTACLVSPGPPGYGGVTVSPLPAVVVLGADPYYYQNGNYYLYQNNNWRYSQSKSGPWTDLPRSHWPKEVRHNSGKDNYQDRGRSDDRGRDDRGRDDRGRDDRGRDNRQDYDKR